MSPSFDDYEIADALQWDEPSTKPAPNFSASATHAAPTSPKSSSILPGTASGRSADFLRSSHQNGVDQKKPNRQDPASRTRGASQSSQRPIGQNGDNEHQKSRLSKEWAKDNLVTTSKQVQIDKTTNQALWKDQFLNQPTNVYFAVTSRYLWPYDDEELEPYTIFGDNMRALNDIRKLCGVYIDLDAASKSIRIRSQSRENNDHALEKLRFVVRSARANFYDDSNTVLFVEPPIRAGAKTLVVPKRSILLNKCNEPLVEGVTLSGLPLPHEDVSAWEEERVGLMKENRDHLLRHLITKFDRLKALQCGMRMRVHFGHMEITRYPKDFANKPYSIQKFLKMKVNTRMQAQLKKNLGDVCLSTKIKSLIALHPDDFSPGDSVTSKVTDVKPRHSLVIVVRTPSRDFVRVEAEFDETKYEVLRGKKIAWQIGATHCYRHNDRKTRLKVGILGFDNMEVVSEVVIPEIPNEIKLLVRRCGDPVERKDEFGFTYPSVTSPTIPGINIMGIWIRSVEQYALTGTTYILESAVYRKWEGTSTVANPSIDYGLTLYNKDWDFLMGAQEADRGWDKELTDFFPGTNFENGLLDFLERIESMRLFLDKIH